jgi:hypothetical protein
MHLSITWTAYEYKCTNAEHCVHHRAGDQLEAIAYARKYFANAAAASKEYMSMIKSAMASLAFPVDTDCEPYKVMPACTCALQVEQWIGSVESCMLCAYVMHAFACRPCSRTRVGIC